MVSMSEFQYLPIIGLLADKYIKIRLARRRQIATLVSCYAVANTVTTK